MSTEKDNVMVWDHRPGHYEVWYATLSHRATQTGFWIRYTLEAPLPGHGEPYAQLWFARFDGNDSANNFGINHRFPIASLRTSESPFSLKIGEAELTHEGMRGSLSGDGHEVSWNLRWPPGEHTRRMLPDFAYKSSLVITKAHSPNNSVPASGEIVVDGKTYTLAGDPLGQTHLWGRKHAYSWAWAHCNGFDGDSTASLEALSVRLKRGSIILPTLTLFTLFLDGEEIAFRQPWTLPLARSSYKTGHYQLNGASADTKVDMVFTCRPDEMILAEYLDPDGDPAFCHNCCSAAGKVQVWKRSPFVGRWREYRTLTAAKTAHFEWAGRAGDALQVKRVHRTI
jgi:hypothetical protein